MTTPDRDHVTEICNGCGDRWDPGALAMCGGLCPACIDEKHADPPPPAVPPEGRKDDAGKLEYDLLPDEAIDAVTRVLMYGAEKYGAHNWKRVEGAEARYMNAARRHLRAHRSGELTDPESGESHLAHAACSVLFLLAMAER